MPGGAIGKYLTNDNLSRHCGTGERQKYDDLSHHSGTQEVNIGLVITDRSLPGKNVIFSSQGFLGGFSYLKAYSLKKLLDHPKIFRKFNIAARNAKWPSNYLEL